MEEGQGRGVPGKKRAVFGGERVVVDFHLADDGECKLWVGLSAETCCVERAVGRCMCRLGHGIDGLRGRSASNERPATDCFIAVVYGTKARCQVGIAGSADHCVLHVSMACLDVCRSEKWLRRVRPRHWLGSSMPFYRRALALLNACFDFYLDVLSISRVSSIDLHSPARPSNCTCPARVQPLTITPPLGCRLWPEMKDESCEARNTKHVAISDG